MGLKRDRGRSPAVVLAIRMTENTTITVTQRAHESTDIRALTTTHKEMGYRPGVPPSPQPRPLAEKCSKKSLSHCNRRMNSTAHGSMRFMREGLIFRNPIIGGSKRAKRTTRAKLPMLADTACGRVPWQARGASWPCRLQLTLTQSREI
jgi:hypothetical protein